ncbi:SH3 domain-containing protein [Streptomyces sp. NPDC001530]|uniref:SH3 domain-containing protein n=1 Tax=Streptomyces sp. NPDC001530 TaxID=3364582 RepID=UPI00369246E6
MSLRSTYTRLAIALAAGSLVALAGATPALADEDRDPGSGDDRQRSEGGDGGFGNGGDVRFGNDDEGGDDDLDDPDTTRGRVNVDGGLALRTRPDRDSRLVRIARNGEIVRIYCQTWGDRDDDLWYLVTDGTWAWGPARFIEASSTPRWC